MPMIWVTDYDGTRRSVNSDRIIFMEWDETKHITYLYMDDNKTTLHAKETAEKLHDRINASESEVSSILDRIRTVIKDNENQHGDEQDDAASFNAIVTIMSELKG